MIQITSKPWPRPAPRSGDFDSAVKWQTRANALRSRDEDRILIGESRLKPYREKTKPDRVSTRPPLEIPSSLTSPNHPAKIQRRDKMLVAGLGSLPRPANRESGANPERPRRGNWALTGVTPLMPLLVGS